MPTIIANARAITKAINGTPAVYSIERHDRLYLEVRGDGKAAWRICYRPRPNANQRWYTIAEDARAVPFDDVARKANELLSGLQLQGVDPHALKPIALDSERSVELCFRAWLDHTGKRRGKAIAPLTRSGYETLFERHVRQHVGNIALSRLDRATVVRTIETVKKSSTNPEKKFRGLQATKVLKLLSSICEWAIDQQWIDKSPCRGIALPVPITHPLGKQSRPPTNANFANSGTKPRTY